MSDTELSDPTSRAPFAGPDALDRVKGEITFFMEKTFQVSFGYVGAIVALGAALSLNVVTEIASAVDIGVKPLVCGSVLVLNTVYLVLAAGTLFATIKRGVFLIVYSGEADGHRYWEGFVRKSATSPFGGGWLGDLCWNLDNVYMVPLFLLIGAVSVASAILGFSSAATVAEDAVVAFGVALHAVPAFILAAICRLAMTANGLAEGGR